MGEGLARTALASVVGALVAGMLLMMTFTRSATGMAEALDGVSARLDAATARLERIETRLDALEKRRAALERRDEQRWRTRQE